MKNLKLNHAVIWSLLALLFPMLAACGSSAQVTSTPAVATTVAIASNPTTVPQPTTVPTASTAPQTTTTSIPTTEVTLKSLAGLWERSDQERGQLYLFFSEQGTYKAVHGTPADTVHAGAFELNGAEVSFLDGWDECAQGSYQLRIISVAGKDVLIFIPIDDPTCEDRVDGIRGRWSRFVRP